MLRFLTQYTDMMCSEGTRGCNARQSNGPRCTSPRRHPNWVASANGPGLFASVISYLEDSCMLPPPTPSPSPSPLPSGEVSSGEVSSGELPPPPPPPPPPPLPPLGPGEVSSGEVSSEELPPLEDGSGSGSGELGSGSGELGSGSGDDGSGELPLQPATLNERYGHNRSWCVTSLPLVSTSLVPPAADVPAGYVRTPEEVNQTHNGGTCAPLPAAETLTHNNLSTSQAYHIFPGALAPDVLSSYPYSSIGALLAYQ